MVYVIVTRMTLFVQIFEVQNSRGSLFTLAYFPCNCPAPMLFPQRTHSPLEGSSVLGLPRPEVKPGGSSGSTNFTQGFL